MPLPSAANPRRRHPHRNPSFLLPRHPVRAREHPRRAPDLPRGLNLGGEMAARMPGRLKASSARLILIPIMATVARRIHASVFLRRRR